MPKTQSDHAGPKLAYSVREAATLQTYGYDRLLEFIKAGKLKARREESEKGNPGKYVILHQDLVDFLENLPQAS